MNILRNENGGRLIMNTEAESYLLASFVLFLVSFFHLLDRECNFDVQTPHLTTSGGEFGWGGTSVKR